MPQQIRISIFQRNRWSTRQRVGNVGFHCHTMFLRRLCAQHEHLRKRLGLVRTVAIPHTTDHLTMRLVSSPTSQLDFYAPRRRLSGQCPGSALLRKSPRYMTRGQCVLHFFSDVSKCNDSIRVHSLIPEMVTCGYTVEILSLGSLTHNPLPSISGWDGFQRHRRRLRLQFFGWMPAKLLFGPEVSCTDWCRLWSSVRWVKSEIMTNLRSPQETAASSFAKHAIEIGRTVRDFACGIGSGPVQHISPPGQRLLTQPSS